MVLSRFFHMPRGHVAPREPKSEADQFLDYVAQELGGQGSTVSDPERLKGFLVETTKQYEAEKAAPSYMPGYSPAERGGVERPRTAQTDWNTGQTLVPREEPPSLMRPLITPEMVERVPTPLRPIASGVREMSSPVMIGTTLLTAGAGPAIAGGIRGGTGAVGAVRGIAAGAAAPVLEKAPFAARAGAEFAVGAAANAAPQYLPEDAPTWARLGTGIAAGVASGAAINRVAAPQQVLRGTVNGQEVSVPVGKVRASPEEIEELKRLSQRADELDREILGASEDLAVREETRSPIRRTQPWMKGHSDEELADFARQEGIPERDLYSNDDWADSIDSLALRGFKSGDFRVPERSRAGRIRSSGSKLSSLEKEQEQVKARMDEILGAVETDEAPAGQGVQASMGIGEKPPQGALFDTAKKQGDVAPTAADDVLRNEQAKAAARSLVKQGQQQIPVPDDHAARVAAHKERNRLDAFNSQREANAEWERLHPSTPEKPISQPPRPPAVASAQGPTARARPAAPVTSEPPYLSRRLPSDLRGATPRYKTKTLQFASDVDKALYIIANPNTQSKAHARYVAWLRSEFGNEADLIGTGRRIRQMVGQGAENSVGTNHRVPDTGLSPRPAPPTPQFEQGPGFASGPIPHNPELAPPVGQKIIPPSGQPMPAAGPVPTQGSFNKVPKPSGTGAPPNGPLARNLPLDGEPPRPPDVPTKFPDPEEPLSEALDLLPTNHESPGIGVLRKYGGATQKAAAERLLLVKDHGAKHLRAVGLNPNNVTRADTEALYSALHGEGPVPTGPLGAIYRDVRRLVDEESAKMKEFMAKRAQPQGTLVDVPVGLMDDGTYFYRGWKITPKGVASGGGPVGTKPSFLKGRNKATFSEMVEAGFEPQSWNPYEMAAIRSKLGEEFRQTTVLAERLRKLGVAVPTKDAPTGYRVPKVGPAFEGRFVGEVTDAQGSRVVQAWAVPNRVADAIEANFGKRPELRVGGKEILGPINASTNFLKALKLTASVFQDVDLLSRAGASSFTPSGVVRGAPLKLPSLVAQSVKSRLLTEPRFEIARRALSTKPFASSKKGVTPAMVAEEGWQLGGDTSIFGKQFGDFVAEAVKEGRAPNMAERAGTAISQSAVARAVRKANEFSQSGLFTGTYRLAQQFALENAIIPTLERQHPTWTARQIAAEAANQVNVMMSTLGNWQTVLAQPNMRELTRQVMFSTNESEALLRQAFSTIVGPNKRLWLQYSAGMFIFLAVVANLIHLAVTKKPLPADRYVPLEPSQYSPTGIGYNNNFLSPDTPIKGRDGETVTLDVVGQMDTVFRLTDPGSFIESRENILPRAVLEQTTGETFGGEKLKTAGERVVAGARSLAEPIGAGNLVNLAAGKTDLIHSTEPRLGALGSVVQTSGVNLRAETTPDYLERIEQEEATKLGRSLNQLEKLDLRKKPEVQKLIVQRATDRPDSYSGRKIIAEADYYQREVDLMERFFNNTLYPKTAEGKATTPAQQRARLVDEYYTLQAERRGELGQIREEFPSDYEADKLGATGPEDTALQEYFDILDQSVNQVGNFDSVVYKKLKAEKMKTWTPAQKAYVEEYRKTKEHPPVLWAMTGDWESGTTLQASGFARAKADWERLKKTELRQDLMEIAAKTDLPVAVGQ